ncbi:MAG: hypothetical protein ABS955_09040 [Stenotrophomonas maltophilia]
MLALISFFVGVSLLNVARAEGVLYVNYAPDKRYASDDDVSRLVIIPERGLYGYGADFGKLRGCDGDEVRQCIAVDFMAIRGLPEGAKVGDNFSAGEFAFRVSRKIVIPMLSGGRDLLRVDVRRDGVYANSFLFDSERGVVAIVVRNFQNKDIPESIFFLREGSGIFSRGASR